MSETLLQPADAMLQPADAIQIASQLGRLDFISALLAVVALIIAVLTIFTAFPLLRYVRIRTEIVAREETTAQMEKLTAKLEAEAISKMEAMLPNLVKDYMD